jgi:hypothetical protein
MASQKKVLSAKISHSRQRETKPLNTNQPPLYVKTNTGSQAGSANRFGQRRRLGAKVRPAGRSSGSSVFNTPLFY